MNIPTKHMTQAEFDALPVTKVGSYDQSPPCRFFSATRQWLYIAPGECAVIEVVDAKKAKLLDAVKAIKSGYGGVDAQGRVVDRRDNPTAIPIPENPTLGTPKPR